MCYILSLGAFLVATKKKNLLPLFLLAGWLFKFPDVPGWGDPGIGVVSSSTVGLQKF